MATYDPVWYVNYGDGSTTGYFAVTKWAVSTTKHCGDVVRQNAAPAYNAERTFICIASTSGTGQTGGSEPTWSTGRGAKTTDNTVTWMEASGIAALCGDLTNTPTWANSNIKNHAISIGQVIQNVAGTLLLICTTAGTTGNGSEPSWAAFTNAGATTADNTATWTTLGAPSNYAAWANPCARLTAVTNGGVGDHAIAGNTIYVGDNSAETSGSNNITTFLLAGGTLGTVTPIFSIDHTASLPPSNSTIKAGATLQCGNANGAFDIGNSGTNTMYLNGLTLKAGTNSASACSFNFGNVSCKIILENCSVNFFNTSGSSQIVFGNHSQNIWINTTLTCGAAGQNIVFGLCEFEWRYTASAFLGTVVNVPFQPNSAANKCILRGVDFSAYNGTGKFLFANNVEVGATLIDCKGSTACIISAPSQVSFTIDSVRVDSAGTDYAFGRYRYEGTLVHETTIVRTGGASDGNTGISYNVTTTANSSWYAPFECMPIGIWNATTAGNVTVTLYGIWKGAAVPNNDDVWFEAQYLGDSGSPQASVVNSTKASGLATNAALSADTASDWTGQAAAYQTSHAYGAFTGVIKAGNASPQQLWFMSSHSGTGTSGSSTTIFNGQSDGAQVTDNAGGNQIVWQALTRFKMSLTISSPQPQLAGYLYGTIKGGKASSTFYIDPKIVLS